MKRKRKKGKKNSAKTSTSRDERLADVTKKWLLAIKLVKTKLISFTVYLNKFLISMVMTLLLQESSFSYQNNISSKDD